MECQIKVSKYFVFYLKPELFKNTLPVAQAQLFKEWLISKRELSLKKKKNKKKKAKEKNPT